MREIKFRGKIIESGKKQRPVASLSGNVIEPFSIDGLWTYGSLIQINEHYVSKTDNTLSSDTIQSYIVDVTQKTVEVDSETIGQFTGLKDKNGKEIYERDIIAVKFDTMYIERINWKGEPDAVCEVYYDYSGFHLKAKGEKDFRYSSFEDILIKSTFNDMLRMNKTHSEVIGNIYDNSELLGGK